MIQQTGQSITFLAYFTSSKTGKTGLTDVTVTIYAPDGTSTTGLTATAVGGGIYKYTLANPTQTGGYIAIFSTGDTSVDLQSVPSCWEVGVAGCNHLDADVSAVDSAVGNVPQAVWSLSLADAPDGTGVMSGALLDAASRIDATVSSRLAASAYSAAPTAADVRNEMDGNSTKLAHLDADVSSRLAASAYSAAPSASAVAAAVLDATDGAGTGYTIRDAIKAALADAVGNMSIANGVQTIQNPDGTIAVQFTLSPSGGPYTGRTRS